MMRVHMPVWARSTAQHSRRFFNARTSRAMLLLLLLFSLGAVSALPASASRPLALDTQNKFTLSTGVSMGEAAWADFNNDSYLDLVLTGWYMGNPISTLFQNNHTDDLATNPSVLDPMESSSADWGDYDNDGYLDLVLTGHYGVNTAFTDIYHNVSAGTFGNRRLTSALTLTGVYNGAARWGDYDNDGRLDLLVTGTTPGAVPNTGTPFTRIYHNNGGGSFSDAGFSGLVALEYSAAAWGNYDGDSYLDFAISGLDVSGTPRLYVYHNLSGSFNSTSLVTIERSSAPTQIGLHSGTVNWFDYNRDRYPDLLVSGSATPKEEPSSPNTVLYVYNTSTKKFQEVTGTGLPNLWNSSVSIGDYDNDGLSDILLNGQTVTVRPTAIYHNNGNGTFSKVSLSPDLADGSYLSVAFGDFSFSKPSDNTLDAVISGISPGGSSSYQTHIYTNVVPNGDPTNEPPAVPQIRAACWNNSTSNPRLTFYWNSTTDDHDNSSSLTYNLRVGTSGANSQDVLSPSADFSSGYLRQPHPGNVGQRRYYPIQRLTTGKAYSWSLQAVDSSYAGSLFSTSGQADVGTRVAYDDSLAVDEDQSLTIPVSSLLANDNAAYAPLQLFSQSSTPNHNGSTLTLDATGTTLTYTPAPHWTGTDYFSYNTVGKNYYCSSAMVTITVNEVNYAPTSISLSPSSLVEGLTAATKVGTLSTTDLDKEETFSYTLLDSHGGVFELRNGNEIWAVQPLSYSHGAYTINVQSTDSGAGNLSIAKNLTITPIQNHAPTAVHLSNLVIPIGQDAGYLVGALSTDDQDASETFSYSFTPSAASYDNAKFTLAGNQLKTGQKFTSPGSYTIHVLSTDSGGMTAEGVFTIQVIDPKPQISCNPITTDQGPFDCAAFSAVGYGQYSVTVEMSEDGKDNQDLDDRFALSLKARPALGTGALTWLVMPPTQGGSASLSANTTQPGEAVQVIYTPAANWNSGSAPTEDVFPIYVTDALGNMSAVSVKVRVAPVNDPPQVSSFPGTLVYQAGSGQHSVEISGLTAGPANESGQPLTVGVVTSLPSGPITDATLSMPVGGKSTLTLTINNIPTEMLDTTSFPLVLYVDDGQPDHNRTQFTIQVSIGQIRFYMPLINQ